ncbi:MAG: branched-chain alpha-keto acid dehydrogenase subunit [Glaciihabitans sp.]|nr:branched-chain alpha-keto acid dehydrogenase subunit [Glaciihabitans sp.]
MTRDFVLPDLGEGLTESELVAWHVVVGELVELNQPIAEVETAKAIVQLPSPFAGVISELYVEPGTTVTVGSRLVAFDLEEDPADTAPVDVVPVDVAPVDVAPAEVAPVARADAAPAQPAPVERTPVLVGYGPPVEGGTRPKRKKASIPPTPRVQPLEPPPANNVQETPRSTPPVRKLASDLGVNLAFLAGTGGDGTITRADVLAATSTVLAPGSTSHSAMHSAPPSVATAAHRATSAAARETRTPIKGMRKATADAMVRSAFTAPHVTEFLTIDVTPTVELLATLRDSKAFAGQRITMLSVVAKALCIAVGRNPSLNSRWDDAAGEIVQFGYVNLGIAVATPRGLMVPNIPDADQLGLADLAAALGLLAETARGGTTTPQSLSGGTISITNVGVFGVDAGTPILNPGEAAILAMGAVRRTPWEFRGEVALRDVMTLSLSFDHRLVDGEQGSRFLTDVGAILANPAIVLTMV